MDVNLIQSAPGGEDEEEGYVKPAEDREEGDAIVPPESVPGGP